VNVWGFVSNPGKYTVPSSTKLVEILSFAGGPTDRARLDDIRIIHDMTIDSTIAEAVVVYNLEEWNRTGDTNSNPLLYPNDTIVVPGDALNVFREVLGIIRDVALVIGTLIALFITVSPGSK
jgi:polysaccharide biosynthesis/export protein